MTKYFNTNYAALALAFLAISLYSCEEVIDIDLNSSDPKMVIEGNIEEGESAQVKLSYTMDYFTPEGFEGVSDATVVLSDNNGNTETLHHTADGLYTSSSIIGELDKSYTLQVQHQDKTYEGESYLFAPVEINNVVNIEHPMSGKPNGPGGGEMADTVYYLQVNFKDNPNEENFYFVTQQVGGESVDYQYEVLNDERTNPNGTLSFSSFRTFHEQGDEVTISVYSIDEATFIYFSQLNDLTGGGMMGSSTPYNPESNFGREALGLFYAFSQTDTIVTVAP